MRRIVLSLLMAGVLGGTTAVADNWKNESGKGRGYWGGPLPWAGRGETPGWSRGKGYWDGHDKHGYPRHYGCREYAYRPFPGRYGRGGYYGGYYPGVNGYPSYGGGYYPSGYYRRVVPSWSQFYFSGTVRWQGQPYFEPVPW
jgi:hypothetical protein